MADLSDVSAAIVSLLAGALYPNGTGQPSAIGAGCKIYPGWPDSTSLDADLRAGLVNISVYPQPNIERVTTRYPQDWEVNVVPPVSSLTANIDGPMVVLSGSVTVGQFVTVLIGGPNGFVASYAAVEGDTLTSITAELAALFASAGVTGTVLAGLSGEWFGPIFFDFLNGGNLGAQQPVATLTFDSTYDGLIIARTGTVGQIIRELRRQQRGYQITVWAPTPGLRAAAASVLDVALSETDFVPLPDLTEAWLKYRGSDDMDKREGAILYRREIRFWAEYATTQVAPGYPITAFVAKLEANNVGVPDLVPLPFGINTPGYTFNPTITLNN